MMPTKISYPETKRVDVVEKPFGQTIADPYRWLENDVRNDKEVAARVESQNKVTNAYLNTLPGRDVFKNRLKQLYNYEQFSIPVKQGRRYFYLYNSGLQNQPVLYVRDSVDGVGRVLIDPNRWSKDGATALAEWSASDDGKRVVYAVQDGGSDWRTIRVLDVNTGKVLDDEIKWVRFSPTIAWAKDGSGFFYARFPEPKQGTESQASVANHAVYFHAIGTPQAQDRLVYATPDQPTLGHYLSLTSDGRYIAIVSTPASIGNKLTVVDLQSADWKPRKLVDNLDDQWSVVGNVGTKFFLKTTQDAPRFKVVTMDIAETDPAIADVVPEQDSILGNASLVGGRLFISQRVDVKTEIRRYTLDGKAWHEAGRRQKKQNVFDDFIAAGEYLKAQNITPQNGLAIQGESNGGLLIGAVVNQRPDLFAAALPGVGVMDMLRFDQFTGGNLWLDEYGSPAQEADFRNLLNYSPYHNIQSGKNYPAILATTADTDDRVVPSHTFKYVAALQAADIGDKPRLVRIETRAGHGAGKPVDKTIEETADMWAFAAHWTGLNVGDGK